MLIEYKPNRPLRSVGSSQLETKVHCKGSLLLAILPPAAGICFQKRSDVLKHLNPDLKLIYKPDSKKVGTLYKLWIKKECNNLQIS